MFSYCFPPNSLSESDRSLQLQSFRARVALEEDSSVDEFLKQKVATKGFLESSNFDCDAALAKLQACSKWRQEGGHNAITLQDVKHEVECGMARWIGSDIKGRPILFITPRINNSLTSKQLVKYFRKFFIKTIELGIQVCEQCGQDKFTIVYDRRQLEHRQIDSHMYTMLRRTINECREYYSTFVDRLLVLHSNIVWWTFFHFIVRPLLIFSDFSQRIILLDRPEDLRVYVDPMNLHLLDERVNDLTVKEMIIKQFGMELCPKEAENSNSNINNINSNINDNFDNNSNNYLDNNNNNNSNSNSNKDDSIASSDNSFSHFCAVNKAIIEYYRSAGFNAKFDSDNID